MRRHGVYDNSGAASWCESPVIYFCRDVLYRLFKEAEMNPLEAIREKVRALHDSDPNIHVNVAIPRPKIKLDNRPAQILDIYPNVFRLKDNSMEDGKFYTVKYSDVLTGQIEIVELGRQQSAE